MTPYAQAVDLLGRGVSTDVVLTQLRSAGVSDEDARVVVNAVGRSVPAAPAPEAASAVDLATLPFRGSLLFAVLVLCGASLINAVRLMLLPFELMVLSRSDAATPEFASAVAPVLPFIVLVCGTAALVFRHRAAHALLLSAGALSLLTSLGLALADVAFVDFLIVAPVAAYGSFWINERFRAEG